MTTDIKKWFNNRLQWMQDYDVPFFKKEGLPINCDHIQEVDVYEAHHIQEVNVYEAPKREGGDWKQCLKDKGQAWIITPLQYSSDETYIHRNASGGGTWNGHGPLPLKKNLDTYCTKRRYRLETKEGTGLPTYTMLEYLLTENKPTHALCRITVHNMNIASSQQREGKEIDHQTDSNNRHKRKTSPSHKSMQQGGNFQNTGADFNQQILKRTLLELRKHHSYDDTRKLLLQGLDQVESEILSAASPKEDSTEAPVRNMTHGRCTYLNTMDAGTSIKWQEQDKVEPPRIFLFCAPPVIMYRIIILAPTEAFGKIPAATLEQCNEKGTLQGLVSSCRTHCRPLVENGGRMDQQFASRLASLLLLWCIAAMEIAPHHSVIREWMKFGVWAFATMLAAMVVSKAAENFPWPMKYVAWVMVGASSFSSLYSFFFQREAYLVSTPHVSSV